jgi:phosphoribosylaminoimidazolecarboxamide formyltransferase / IMP cyclohydrolase
MISTKKLPPPEDLRRVRRALVSVYDKSGIVEFARRLEAMSIEIVSTGGTARALIEAGITVVDASQLTGYPDLLDGRVKTLHPAIHGGILARRNDPDDLAQLREHEIRQIDLVVTSLYPFEEATSAPDVTEAAAVENIDIGGPAMIRAAAKNYFFVGVLTAADDYESVVQELEENQGSLTLTTRKRLAAKAFERTSSYDQAITSFLSDQPAEDDDSDQASGTDFSLRLPLSLSLRYGENPHQSAALYGRPERLFETLHGKELSFNNLLDLSAALYLIEEFKEAAPTCAILKHTNPCGVAVDRVLSVAYRKAFATDTQSPFGGIVVVNRPLDLETARAIDEIFTELIIAPDFEAGVLDLLQEKKNRRLIRMRAWPSEILASDVRSVAGGLLVQDRDPSLSDRDTLRSSCQVVTRRGPTEDEWNDLDFAWRVCKHVKSNAIVYARDRSTLGVGAGQMSRIDSSEIAVSKAEKSGLDLSHSVVASDAFFPFADGLLAAARSGARAVIQPGGSVRDDEVIRAADDNGIAMVFTGRRHFRH